MTEPSSPQDGAIGDDAIKDGALHRLGRMLLDGGYRFTTPTPATIARVNARDGNAEATDLQGVFGWSRPFRPALLAPAMLAALEEAGALAREGASLRALLRLSTLDGMGFFHSAYPTEAPDSVFFGPDTYRFAAAIAPALPATVRLAVDIGCGAGPGGMVVARARPAARVVLGDINEGALRLARVNALMNGVGNAVARRSDLLGGVDEAPDLVVSNPPYLNDPLGRAYRHGGGPLGAALSIRILEAAMARLAPGGTLLLYTGVAMVGGTDPFRDAAAAPLAEHRATWSYRELDPDVFGEELETASYRNADRIAAVLLIAKKEG